MDERTPAVRRRAQAEANTVYDLRFAEHERRRKEVAWREIGRWLQRRFIPEDGRVMDLACDVGYFIRNVRAGERRASDLRDTSAGLPSDVRFVQTDGLLLADAVPNDYFDVVFMSNYLEHLDSAESVVEQPRSRGSSSSTSAAPDCPTAYRWHSCRSSRSGCTTCAP